MLTLRQIEIIRAIMVTGTIAGAARLLNVSSPGISRLMKYTEESLGVSLFHRRHGRYVPTPEARNVFDLLDSIHRRVEDLQTAVDRLGSGEGRALAVASEPAIAHALLPAAVEEVKRRFPEIVVDIDVVRIEEAIDYLLLGRGEVVAISARFEHSIIDFVPVATGRLVCLVHEASELARADAATPAQIAREPLIFIDASGPYGRASTDLFRRNGLSYRTSVVTRFATMIGELVEAGLGVAVVDEFTAVRVAPNNCRIIEIAAETRFEAYVAFRSDTALSGYAEAFIESLRSRS